MQAKSLSLILLAIALWMITRFESGGFLARLNTQFEGQIVSSQDVPRSRGSGYVTMYILRAPGGRESVFVVGPTDDPLSRNMPAGTYLKKERWRTYYEENGQRISDSSAKSHLLELGIALVCLVWSFTLWFVRGGHGREPGAGAR